MKVKHGLILSVIAIVFFSGSLLSQTPYVKQVITANSGKFEFMPPYTDFVTLQSFHPENNQVNQFGSIMTQSAQSILVSGHFAFFAAQDSIIKYNINTMQRIAGVADSGLNRMALYNGKLLISRQFPVSQHFFEVRDTADLSLVAEVTGISGDCGGVCAVKDTVYVAVNGGWMGTQGKLAVIDPASWTLKAEVEFGPEAIGIWDLYTTNNIIYSVNKTPWGMPDTGSVTVYNPADRSFNNVILPFKVSAGSGIANGMLFLGLNDGIGSFDLTNWSVVDTVIVPDPGSSMFVYILSSAVDSVEGRIYANIGDYATAGTCLVTSLSGDSITSYPTGISSDAIAIDYRISGLGISQVPKEGNVSVFPNPVKDRLNLEFNLPTVLKSLVITDVSGRKVFERNPGENAQKQYSFDLGELNQGTYYLMIMTADGRVVKPIVVAPH